MTSTISNELSGVAEQIITELPEQVPKQVNTEIPVLQLSSEEIPSEKESSKYASEKVNDVAGKTAEKLGDVQRKKSTMWQVLVFTMVFLIKFVWSGFAAIVRECLDELITTLNGDVEQMYTKMDSRHRVHHHCIQIIKTDTIPAKPCKRHRVP